MSEPREPLEAHLAPSYDEARIAQTWQRIAEARDRRPYERRRLPLLAVPILAAGAAAAVIVLATRTPAPATAPTPAPRSPLASLDRATSVAPGAELTAGPADRAAVALDDGSQVVLDPGARLQILSNDGERFSTLHVRGTIAYEVRPGGSRRWEIETAFATVEIVGTRVVIARAEHAVAIKVERGVVMVRGERVAGRVQRLTAGQELVVGEAAPTGETAAAPPTPAPETAPDPATATAPAPAPTGAPAPAPTGAPAPAPTTTPAPVPPARTAPTAPAEPAARPPLPAVTELAPAPRPIAASIDEADRLRQTDPEAAAALLERAIASRPDDPAAGLAAFALGRLYLETLAQPGRAAEVFRRIVDRGSPRALLEDAHSRLVEALLASGERRRAREAFEEYARKYPDGRRTAALRARVGAP